MKQNGEPFLKCTMELLEESQAASQLKCSEDVLGRIFGSVIHKQGRGEDHHFAKHDCIEDITTQAWEHLKTVFGKHSLFGNDFILFLFTCYTASLFFVTKLHLFHNVNHMSMKAWYACRSPTVRLFWEPSRPFRNEDVL